ncbi:MAG TPA: hypothetical protein VG322_07460 [Candidatus Acidoferrales bacterium]|nr:hypothetical protein [Candidatus Acidoferrales bacterium]
MLGPFDYAIWVIGSILEVAVVLCALHRRSFLRYLSLNLYMLATVAVNCVTYLSLEKYGVRSREYHFAYYYTDSLLTILMFFVIIQLYQQVLAQMNASGYVRRVATVVLAATSLFSYLVVYRHRANLTDQFVIAFGQNLYFVGVVLTYFLWAAIFKMGETRRRLVHFVLALGIYFSGIAGAYALRHLFPNLQPLVLHWIPPLAATWLPLAWAYTFFRIPEEERFAMGQLAPKTP